MLYPRITEEELLKVHKVINKEFGYIYNRLARGKGRELTKKEVYNWFLKKEIHYTVGHKVSLTKEEKDEIINLLNLKMILGD